MAEEIDTYWFNLNKYEGLKDLDLAGWKTQIDFRYRMNLYLSDEIYSPNEDFDIQKLTIELYQSAKDMLEKLKNNPIIENFGVIPINIPWEKPVDYRSRYLFNTTSVYSTTAYDIWLISTLDELNAVWNLCESEWRRNLYDKRDEERCSLIKTPIDLLFKSHNNLWSSTHNLSIDLAATDEKILTDFRHWLTEYRKAIGYETRKKSFTDKDLGEWFQWRLLPYIDLKLAATIEKKLLKQTKAANLIFCDEYEVSTVDRLRRTTIPKASWLLRDETISAIYAQLKT